VEAESVVADEAVIASADSADIVDVPTTDLAPPALAQTVELESAAVATDTSAAVETLPFTAAEIEAEPIEPVQTENVIVALAPVPVPTPRPAYTPPAPKKAEAAPATSKPRQAAKKTTRSGSRGENARDTKQGTSDGGLSSSQGAAQRSEHRTASTAGNAAVSNYPGKIVSELRRSLRYPSEAKRNRITGEVRIRFVVTANGAAESIRIVRSSGSPILDQAALETVRRAAPFPAIPRAADRNNWPFTVPLAAISQCPPMARITSGGRFHPDSSRLVW
jgi:protein TonB